MMWGNFMTEAVMIILSSSNSLIYFKLEWIISSIRIVFWGKMVKDSQ